ncbi:glycosyltransferase [Paenibacillus piscarius]|uniref:glycosyltransferase n=1 Tax=Paenibacillus piscarius TaxID=1089681 RepID=UPI001EE7B17B|nr:glycosyltransferase [Paenibacillus piscarius]
MEFTGERFIPQLSDKQTELEHLQRYFAIAPLVEGKVVLDAACGEGYGSNILSKYADRVYGIDLSKEAIQLAKIKYSQSGIHFIEGSIVDLKIPDHSIDILVSLETIEHVDEEAQNKFMKEIQRVLKDDGFLIMSTPDKYWYSDIPNHNNPFHVKEFYEHEYRAFLENYFPNVNFYYQKFEIASLIMNQNSSIIQHLSNEDEFSQINDGKYIIAVCGKYNTSNIRIDSVAYSKEFKFQDYINRIVSLQEEVEDRNKHIKYLDETILKSKVDLKKIENEAADSELLLLENKEALAKQVKENERVNEEFKKLENLNKQLIEELEEKKLNIETVEGALISQKAYIQELKIKEDQLSRILNSGGWEGLTAYYRLRDKIIPDSSKRKLAAKLLVTLLRKPRQTIKLINFANIRKLKYYNSTESTSMLKDRIDNYMERHTIEPTQGVLLTPVQKYIEKEKLVFPVFQKPLVSIIIPVYNQWEYTYNCLQSILQHKESVDSFEVIIADDLSSDETIDILKFVENIHVLRDGVNRGFLLNCNNAAKFAKGKYILFLNNDTNVQPGWLSSLSDLLEKYPDIGMAGSKLVYPDGRLQEAGGIIWNDASGWNYGRLNNPDNSEFNYVKEVDYISGAAIILRKSLWEKIGGFDERYAPAYFEDSDLAFEVRRQGYKVVLQPRSIVVHFEGISHGTDVQSGIKSYQIENKAKFIEKWEEVLHEQYSNGENVFKARDRSKNKKTVLIIDHYVPHYDKDAGSRTVFQYIQYFISNNMNVKFIGDNYFRHEPYTTTLQQMGVEVLYGPSYEKDIKKWFKVNGQYFDFVFMNRPHISIKYIDWIKEFTQAKVIYYGHDLHYLREEREYELTGNPVLLKQAENWREIEGELFEKSDVVYYPSQVEVDKIKEQFTALNVKAIPAYIYDASERLFIQRVPAQTTDLLFVGGFGHKPNVDAVIWFVSQVYPIVLKSIPDIKLNIVGSNPPDVIKQLQSDNVIVHGFVSDERLAELYSVSRIDIVPLRYGAGVKGKVVEALYHQIPIVTTSVGAEGLPNIENHLLIADSEEDFASEIVGIYNNEERLDELSKDSLIYIQQYFSSARVEQIIDEDFS